MVLGKLPAPRRRSVWMIAGQGPIALAVGAGEGCLDIFGWSGGAMVLGKLPVLGHPTLWNKVGQGPIALAVGGGLFGHFYSPLSFLSSFSLSLGDGPI